MLALWPCPHVVVESLAPTTSCDASRVPAAKTNGIALNLAPFGLVPRRGCELIERTLLTATIRCGPLSVRTQDIVCASFASPISSQPRSERPLVVCQLLISILFGTRFAELQNRRVGQAARIGCVSTTTKRRPAADALCYR